MAEKKKKPKCEHKPVTKIEGAILPGTFGFSYFNVWHCYECGIPLKAKWEPLTYNNLSPIRFQERILNCLYVCIEEITDCASGMDRPIYVLWAKGAVAWFENPPNPKHWKELIQYTASDCVFTHPPRDYKGESK